jgi:hypothetical protein
MHCLLRSIVIHLMKWGVWLGGGLHCFSFQFGLTQQRECVWSWHRRQLFHLKLNRCVVQEEREIKWSYCVDLFVIGCGNWSRWILSKGPAIHPKGPHTPWVKLYCLTVYKKIAQKLNWMFSGTAQFSHQVCRFFWVSSVCLLVRVTGG